MNLEALSHNIKEQTASGFRSLKKDIVDLSSAVKLKAKKVISPTRDRIKKSGGHPIEISGDIPSETQLQPAVEEVNVKPPAWSNWAGTQTADPAQIFNPKTLEDLISIVLQAKVAKKKVRCAGSGHTWSSSSVVQEEGFLVVVNDMAKMYDPVQIHKKADGEGKEDVWTVEVETGVLVKDLDDFLRKHDPPLALPSNVVLDSVRYGGILSLGCHGAATHTRTLPELVSAVKIVDATGTLHTFTKEKDPLEFSAATVNLGLLGIIYSYTLRVGPMFKLHTTDTFPPLSDYFSSPTLDGPKLKALVLGNDQTEIFYWPFNTAGLGAANDHIWLKQWQRPVTDLPLSESSEKETFQKLLQNMETAFGNKLYEFMAANPASTPFLSCLIYSMLKKDSEQVLEAPEAIHYQAGIDNLKCLDTEMAFKADDKFENVVKAWNYVIELMYEYANRKEFPLNLTMEMRFVKSSQMIMSNAYDKDPDAIYCMIEILSVVNTKGFEEFSAKVAKYWMDEFNARPHWAKMWEFIPGIVQYLRRQAGHQYDQFEIVRKKYDPEGMFMNTTFTGLLGH
ncbi:hypothetical protein EDD21DRAFT_427884 [Dissophora ornata]|nr:hypothetical protein BGZ58_000318 [Dissophora ornata]KAI8605953.1 hypothetical protein EDD21DRAFT_427884 [Dissophora ornata]